MDKKVNLDDQARLRLRWIEHYEKVTHKVAVTCRYFGISRGTFYLKKQLKNYLFPEQI